jgi:hypothetical protein
MNHYLCCADVVARHFHYHQRSFTMGTFCRNERNPVWTLANRTTANEISQMDATHYRKESRGLLMVIRSV